jgi:DNA polymerase IV
VSKIIMHVDLNAFFATAEELRDPSLVGKPLVVGGVGPRSVVSTASYEARKYGIHSGMPIYQARNLCPRCIFKPCDFRYYEMLSGSFFAYISKYSPLVEKASIDECYVDMTKPLSKTHDVLGYLTAVQTGLLEQIGLKCSIGVAPTKFLAKMASDMKKPMGITILRRKDLPEKLYPQPIESFYGIGKKTAPRLRELGIATIGDLAARTSLDDPALIGELGKFFYVIKDWVAGLGSDQIDTTPSDPKSIGHSSTFEHDTGDEAEIEAEIEQQCREVAAGAHAEGKKGRTIQLQVKDPSFRIHDKSVSLREPTDAYEVIYEKAVSLYRNAFLGLQIRLVGVTLANLVDPHEETVQMSLFNYKEYEEMDRTKLLINELNRKMKKPLLMRGSEAKKDGHK